MTAALEDEILKLLKPIELGPLPERPLVSVLMANYNYARYIGQAIESVLAQTYNHWELIICDDGSTDNSWEIIERYQRQDQRIRAVRQPNGGMACALNAAYRKSKGEIICLLDSDDCYLPEKLKAVVRAFCAHSDSGYLQHGLYRIDSKGRRRGVTPLFRRFPSGWFGPFVLMNGGSMPWGAAPSSGLCLRSPVVEHMFPLPQRFRRSADGVVQALSPLLTSMIGINAPLGEWREHGANLTQKSLAEPSVLERELHISKDIWNLQKEYLLCRDPRLGCRLAPWESVLWVGQTEYARARLSGNRAVLAAYRNLIALKSFGSLPLLTRCFWRASILLPPALFGRALMFVGGGGYLKKCLEQLAKRARGRRPPVNGQVPQLCSTRANGPT